MTDKSEERGKAYPWEPWEALKPRIDAALKENEK